MLDDFAIRSRKNLAQVGLTQAPISEPPLLPSPNWILRVLLRQSYTILATTAFAATLALLYLLLMPPSFTARGSLIFEPKALNLVSNPTEQKNLNLDQYTIAIDTQIELLGSRSVATKVIGRLQLNERYKSESPSWLGRLRTWLMSTFGVGRVDRLEGGAIAPATYKRFFANLNVDRRDLSSIIDVDFSDPNPSLAANVSNAIIDAFLQEQRKIKVDAVSNSRRWLVSRVEQLRQEIIDLKRRRGPSGRPTLGLTEAELTAKTSMSVYESFLKRLTELQAQEISQKPDARIVSVATPPTAPSKPEKALTMALSLVTGLGIGVLLAFWRNMRDPILYTKEDVEARINAPILAELPFVGPEGVRVIATKVLDATVTNGRSFVNVISLPRGEDSTALSVARFVASSGLKTLLVEWNPQNSVFRRSAHTSPTLCDVANGSATLSEVLIDDDQTDLTMCAAVEAQMEKSAHCSVLPLAQMADLTRSMQEKFELVIFATSPLNEPLLNARLLTRFANFTVVLLELGKTTSVDLQTVAEQIESSNAQFLGLVLTRLRRADRRQIHPRIYGVR